MLTIDHLENGSKLQGRVKLNKRAHIIMGILHKITDKSLITNENHDLDRLQTDKEKFQVLTAKLELFLFGLFIL